MITFLDSIGLERVDVMGYHTGSLTSADLAMRYPDRIRKVVMISAPIFDEMLFAETTMPFWATVGALAACAACDAKMLTTINTIVMPTFTKTVFAISIIAS